MRLSFDPKDCIALLNNCKEAMQLTGTPFTKESMFRTLKGCGLPTTSTFWMLFKRKGIIQEVKHGYYLFTSKQPIYIGVLQDLKREYTEYYRKYRKKPLQAKIVDRNSEIKAAISILIEAGYKVFKPVTSYEEI